MNRRYVLDLRPGNSFVEYMVGQGYDVYLLDWGSPGPEDKELRFDDYVLDYMPARHPQGEDGLRLRRSSASSAGASARSSPPSTPRCAPTTASENLILLTAPLDFTDKEAIGFLRQVRRRRYFDVDRRADGRLRQHAGRD